jgi:hypothetical protein
VALATPLDFSGTTLNDPTHWQVSLLSPRYPHNFLNFREDCRLHFVVDQPAESDAVVTETASTNCEATNDVSVDWVNFFMRNE